MESVAAERLNKIGKNPSIVSNREDFADDINTVNELIMQGTPIASSGSSDEDDKLSPLSDDGHREKWEERERKKKDKKDKEKKEKEKDKKESFTHRLSMTLAIKKSKSDAAIVTQEERSRDEQEALV